MRIDRKAYSFRGVLERRRRQRRNAVLLFGCVAAVSFFLHDVTPHTAFASFADGDYLGAAELRRADEELTQVKARLDSAAEQLRQAHSISRYARKYRITQQLAGEVFAAAHAARVDPELAFRLVRAESEFNPRARSPVGAIGLTQLMPTTAFWLDSTATLDSLYNPSFNLRVGLGYLRSLIDSYDGSIQMALTAYNRGPGAVQLTLANGKLPRNSYERAILRGYSGSGILH